MTIEWKLDWLERYLKLAWKIDEAILVAASEMLKVSPVRKQALWEVARVLAERGNFKVSEVYLAQYLAITPLAQQNSEASALLNMIRLRQ